MDSLAENLPVLLTVLIWLCPLVLIDTGIGLLFVFLALRGSWPDQVVRIVTLLFGIVFVTSSGAIMVWGLYTLWTYRLSALAFTL